MKKLDLPRKGKTQYFIASPPISTPFKEMTFQQAELFFEWYIHEIPVRLSILTSLVQFTKSYENWTCSLEPESLAPLGRWFCKQIEAEKKDVLPLNFPHKKYPNSVFSIDVPAYRLSNYSISLCLDVGIYLSQVMVKYNNNLHWEIRNKRKSDKYFNQPVLRGSGSLVFCPTEIVITYGYAIVQELIGEDGLRELFDIWSNILQEDNTI